MKNNNFNRLSNNFRDNPLGKFIFQKSLTGNLRLLQKKPNARLLKGPIVSFFGNITYRSFADKNMLGNLNPES